MSKKDKAMYKSGKSYHRPLRPGQKNRPLQIDEGMAAMEKSFRKVNYSTSTLFEELSAVRGDWKPLSSSESLLFSARLCANSARMVVSKGGELQVKNKGHEGNDNNVSSLAIVNPSV